MLVNKEEQMRIKMKCSFDDEKQTWDIPPFYFKAKELHFPKFNGQQAVEAEKENRDVAFGQDSRLEARAGGSKQSRSKSRRNKDKPDIGVEKDMAKYGDTLNPPSDGGLRASPSPNRMD